MATEAQTSIRRRVVIAGRVQGVGYRASCAHRAQAAELAGSVRNRSDGTVEAIFEGPPDAVSELIEWCRRGPRLAKVAHLDIFEEDPAGLEHFSVLTDG